MRFVRIVDDHPSFKDGKNGFDWLLSRPQWLTDPGSEIMARMLADGRFAVRNSKALLERLKLSQPWLKRRLGAKSLKVRRRKDIERGQGRGAGEGMWIDAGISPPLKAGNMNPSCGIQKAVFCSISKRRVWRHQLRGWSWWHGGGRSQDEVGW